MQLGRVSAPTCFLCARGWMVFLLREASGIGLILTARLLDVSKAAI